MLEHFKMSAANSTGGNIRLLNESWHILVGTVRPKVGNSNFVPID